MVLSATVIKILPFLLSSAFESTTHAKLEVCNSNGELDYFKRNFHIRFTAIT